MRRIGPVRVSWRHAVAVLVLLGACSVEPDLVRGPDPLANASKIPTVPPTLGAADCDPPSPSQPLRSNTEVRGAATDGTTLWARFPGASPYPSGTPLEVTWRINGRHALGIALVDAHGVETQVDEVERDRSVRWARPGDAWVSTIEFDHPGCWRIYIARGDNRRGDVWIDVA